MSHAASYSIEKGPLKLMPQLIPTPISPLPASLFGILMVGKEEEKLLKLRRKLQNTECVHY